MHVELENHCVHHRSIDENIINTAVHLGQFLQFVCCGRRGDRRESRGGGGTVGRRGGYRRMSGYNLLHLITSRKQQLPSEQRSCSRPSGPAASHRHSTQLWQTCRSCWCPCADTCTCCRSLSSALSTLVLWLWYLRRALASVQPWLQLLSGVCCPLQERE